MSSMRIAVANLTGGGMSGGTRHYIQTVVPLLRQDSRVADVALYTRRGASLPGCDPVDVYAGDSTFGYIRHLKQEIKRTRPDVIFIPNFWHLRSPRIPVVTMLHNMEIVSQPVGRCAAPVIARNLTRLALTWWGCLRSDRVIAVSQFVKEFLSQKWHIPEHKIDLVYHGIAIPEENCPMCRPPSLEGRVVEPFVFTAGSIRPYRGLEDLLRAAAQPAMRARGVRVVIAGAVDAGNEFYKRELDDLARQLRISEQIYYAGSLPLEQMNWCFRHCAAVAMASRIESFCFVGAEAMSHGCLMASTLSRCLPEVLGDGALYYPAGDGEKLAQQLEALLSASPVEQAQWRERARRQAARFTWCATRAGTVESLERAIAGKRRTG